MNAFSKNITNTQLDLQCQRFQLEGIKDASSHVNLYTTWIMRQKILQTNKVKHK